MLQCFVNVAQHLSAFMNEMANFKFSNFTPQQWTTYHFRKLYCGAVNCATDVMFYSLEWWNLCCAQHERLNTCCAFLNIATSVGSFKTAESFTKQTRHSSEKVPAIFQETARIFVQTVKFPPAISRNSSAATVRPKRPWPSPKQPC